MLIKEAVETFLKGYFSTCNLTDKTYKAYSSDLSQFEEWVGNEIHLEMITPEMIEVWFSVLDSKGYKPSSLQRKLVSLKIFFHYWVRKKVLANSPLWHLRIQLKKDKQLPKYLERSEIESLISTARKEFSRYQHTTIAEMGRPFLSLRNQVMVELLFATGIRVGELVQLGRNDYILDEGAFLIKGKGQRQRLAFLTDTALVKTVKRYLELRQTIASNEESLLINVFQRPLSTQGVANALTKLAAEAGLKRKITPHMLRHTIATLLLQNGADLRIVQEFLGHASITTTQIYTQVSKTHLVESLKKHHPMKGFKK